MLTGLLRLLLFAGCAALACGASTAALAQSDTQQPPAQNETAAPPAAKPYPQGLTCVWMPSLRSQFYSVIDDQHLVMDSAPNRKFLITLARRCFDLDTTLDIGIDAHGNQLCNGDAILIGRDRCVIEYIEEVANEAEAKAIVAGRKAAEKAKRDN